MPLPGTGWQRRAAGADPGRWGTILIPVRLTSNMSFPRRLHDPWVWGQMILFLLVAPGLPIALRHTSPGSALGRIPRPTGLLVAGIPLAYFDREAAAEGRRLAARFPEYHTCRDGVGRLLPRLR